VGHVRSEKQIRNDNFRAGKKLTDDLTIAGRAGVPNPAKLRRAEALCQEGGSKNHPGSVGDYKPGNA
jgi:hypothetical protein